MRTVARLRTSAKLLVVVALLFLTIGLVFLSRRRDAHSVIITGWGEHAHLCGVDMTAAIYERPGRISFATTKIRLSADSVRMSRVTIPVGINDTSVSLRVIAPPEGRRLDLMGTDSSAACLGEGWLMLTSEAREIDVTLRSFPSDSAIERELLVTESSLDQAILQDSSPNRLSTLGFRVTHPVAFKMCDEGAHIRLEYGDSIELTSVLDTVVLYPRVSGKGGPGSWATLVDSGRLRLKLGCPPDGLDSIYDIKMTGALLEIDSGAAAVASPLRPQPQEYRLPATVQVTGDLELYMERARGQLRFVVTGAARSLRFINGKESDPARIRKLGTELVPTALESYKDTFLAMAGIIVFFTQLVMFIWNLFKAKKPGDQGQ